MNKFIKNMWKSIISISNATTTGNVWDKMVHYEKSLVSLFQTFFASIDNILVLGGKLGTRLTFYEDLRFSWCFPIS